MVNAVLAAEVFTPTEYTGVIRTLEYLRNALCCIHNYTEYAILTLDIDTLSTYSCQFQHLPQGNKTTRVTA